MNANELIRDAYTTRQIDLTRYSNRVVRQMLALIRKIEADTLAKIEALPEGSRQVGQLEAFLAELRAIYAAGYARVGEQVRAATNDLAGDEIAFGVGTLEAGAATAGITASVQVPLPAQIAAAVQARPFEGRLLGEWLSGLEAGAAQRVRDAIRMGYVEGESVAAIKKRVRQIMPISQRGAEAMVRTAINHTAQAARAEVFASNSDIIEGEMWNAVLDGRTSAVCRGRDGQQYELGKGPRPPAHINCRSYMSPVLIGIEPPPRTDYGTWLARQPIAKQDEILGKAKARLFRDGKLTLDRFIDRAGNEYTLDELRARHQEAWRAAFGNGNEE